MLQAALRDGAQIFPILIGDVGLAIVCKWAGIPRAGFEQRWPTSALRRVPCVEGVNLVAVA